ncbi:Velvet complex subunit LAE1 [Hyphodiscus hymeniophilus]|uniref:Velvet complex subunit LAE1 n=1 Tax=Hyphodiscus hymeniophilus TaxID=353542 RepID=A0A9P6VGK0_9HELO|nr:Velvet complex subunit LAE1 [Hyphodiscus hymeniophilus]
MLDFEDLSKSYHHTDDKTMAEPSSIMPPTAEGTAGQVEIDVNDDHDSSFDEDIASSTTSLSSSIKNHTYENGRRYHAFRAGSYFAPNDDAENDRLDMHHHLATLLLNGKLHLAPIGEGPQRILDVGCGTGIWTIAMGDENPSAQIYGVDISPTQPNLIPPNVTFELDDVETEWTYHEPFDFVHVRFLAASIMDWPRLVQQAYQHTKPGGWCEFKDFDLNIKATDGSLPEDTALVKYHTLLIGAVNTIGRTHAPGPKLKGWVEAAGYENVHEEVSAVPLGTWPKDKRYKEIGLWNFVCLEEGLEGISLRLFTAVLGWKVEDVEVLIEQVRKELKELKKRGIHAQYT